MHAKRQPDKENSRLIPYICSGTALNAILLVSTQRKYSVDSLGPMRTDCK